MAERVTLQVPDQWRTIDFGAGFDAQWDDLVAHYGVEWTDPAMAPLSEALTQDVRKAMAQYADRGALFAVVPSGLVAGMLINAHMVVMPLTPPEGFTPIDALVYQATHDPTAETIGLGERVAVRTTSERDIPSGDGVYRVRQTRYMLGDPRSAERFLDVFIYSQFADVLDETGMPQAVMDLLATMTETLEWSDECSP